MCIRDSAMTGWRMGYIASSQENIEPILKVHQYTTTSPVSYTHLIQTKCYGSKMNLFI